MNGYLELVKLLTLKRRQMASKSFIEDLLAVHELRYQTQYIELLVVDELIVGAGG